MVGTFSGGGKAGSREWTRPPAMLAGHYAKYSSALKIKGGHPHRYRDTFSVGLLQKGVPIEIVATLLGHADVRITQKHHAPWIRSGQEHLEKAVAATWPTDNA